MSQYLRDERLRNISLPPSALRTLHLLILELVGKHNAPIMKEHPTTDAQYANGALMWKYIIRFDGKGFQLFDFDEVLSYLAGAKHIERVCIFVEIAKFGGGSIPRGKHIEVKLDAQQPDNCVLIVQDDDKTWTEASFLRIREELIRHTNSSGWVRNNTVDTICQLAVVGTMFLVCIGAAVGLAPHLKLVYAPMFVFLASFLFFSHLWNVIMGALYWTRDRVFPNIAFNEIERLHWLLETLLGAAALYFVAIGLTRLVGYVSGLLGQIVIANP